MPLTWAPSLATGIRQIDLQHRELIDLVAEFELAHEAGDTARIVEDILQRLTAYALFHFATEETLMRAMPGCHLHGTAHVREHNIFGEKMAALRELSRAERHAETTALLDYLKQWLTNHILKTDKELATLLHNIGGQASS